jgi:hypothetical protein
MEIHDKDDHLDNVQRDGNAFKQYNSFPGFFTKQLISTDNIVSHTRLFTIESAIIPAFDNVYHITDLLSGTPVDHIALSAVIQNDSKFTTYCNNFQQRRLLGFKIQAMAVSSDSPLSGTFTSRIQYPPLHIASFYIPNTVNQLYGRDLLTSDTHFVVPNDGSIETKCVVFNDLKLAGLYSIPENLNIFESNVYIFCNGFISLAVIDPSVSEAYHVIVTAYVAYKDYSTHFSY